ncbi:MAG: ATP-binding cassette domain-containing protein [Clostridia bacterium]|nr:ATP-binding cassette domain-containing protein [Clostridia bacterium]
MRSKAAVNKKTDKNYVLDALYKLGVFAFWIIIWQIASCIVNAEVILPSPMTVLTCFIRLIKTQIFLKSTLSSIGRIMSGYICAVAVSFIAAILMYKSRIAGALLSPVLKIITATPVASFIILALVWIGREKVPSFISALIVLPVMTAHISAGIRSVDLKLQEMCLSYGFSFAKRLILLYIPSSAPEIAAGLATSLGLAWKSGVAAEVLCMPKNSIGRYVYESKLYLETPDLFAWTATVIFLSILIEKLLRKAFALASGKIKASSNIYNKEYMRINKESKDFISENVSNNKIISPGKLSSDIFIKNLSKKFGKNNVFSGLTFDIAAHDSTAVMGPSGCGKTTLMRILCGLEKADSGEVSGVNPIDCAPVFQEPRLLPWLSAAENVACASPKYRLTDKKDSILLAKKLLGAFDIPDYTHDFLPSKLSGGMCQRVSIARALISERPFLLLDEPFRGLDEKLKEKIIFLVKKNSDTILLITHLRREAEQLGAELLEFNQL